MTTQTISSSSAGQHSVCPWWVAYFFDNPIRRMIHPANKVLKPYVTEGMTVLDFGCGFGHYALGMARLTGDSGRVVAADIQEKMLSKMMKRAGKAGLNNIIHPFLCKDDKMGSSLKFDFILASNALHETPNPRAQLEEFFRLLKPGNLFLLIEPVAHLKQRYFEWEISLAKQVGFVEADRPKIIRQMSILLQKPKTSENP